MDKDRNQAVSHILSQKHYNENIGLLQNIQLFMTPAATARSYSYTFLLCEVLEVYFPSRMFAFYLYMCPCHLRNLCSILRVVFPQKRNREVIN